MKKNNKIILILVLIIAIILIGIGIFITTRKEETPTTEPPQEEVTKQEIPKGEGGNSSPEEFYNWETNLYIRASEIIDSAFKNEYTLDENDEFNITFAELESNYNVDLNEFNTETIKCDLTNSTLKVTKNGEEYQKEIFLSCTTTIE